MSGDLALPAAPAVACDDHLHLTAPPSWDAGRCDEMAARLEGEGLVTVCACGFWRIVTRDDGD